MLVKFNKTEPTDVPVIMNEKKCYMSGKNKSGITKPSTSLIFTGLIIYFIEGRSLSRHEVNDLVLK